MSIETRVRGKIIDFGNWQVEESLGGNDLGTSMVFRITRESGAIRESCAMKVISLISHGGRLEDLSAQERIEYEAERDRITAEAQNEVKLMIDAHTSPYVVQYYDHSVSDWAEDNQFGRDLLIRMELLRDLSRQNRTQYTPEDIKKIGIDICRALEYCHSKKIIHRDIKPSNIFVADDGRYKLGDFGISRIVDMDHGIAKTRTGTPAYIAPEQAGAFGGGYDARADIYSLGLTLYELDNGNRLPFAESCYVHEEEIQLRLAGKALPSPGGTDQELNQAILKACEYRPVDRYQTAKEFRKELEITGGTAPDPYKTMLIDRDPDPDSYDLYKTKPVEPVHQKAEWERLLIAGIALLVLLVGILTIRHFKKHEDETMDKDIKQVDDSEDNESKDETGVVVEKQESISDEYRLNIGEHIYFGAYEQDGDTSNGPEPIEWIIINRDEDSVLAISVYTLDTQVYSQTDEYTTWENSEVRKWLNGYFLDSSFTAEERDLIILSHVSSEDNLRYGSSGGNDTEDAIYILSPTEAGMYFPDKGNRVCEGTIYARSHNMYVNSVKHTSPWHLRAPGVDNQHNAYVYSWGEINFDGETVTDTTIGVRPVIKLDASDTSNQQNHIRSKTAVPLESALIGDWVHFGAYEQDGNSENGSEPIEWIVLDKDSQSILAISRYCIDCHAYGAADEFTTWETSELRRWLNNDFMEAAFTEEEIDHLYVNHIQTPDNGESHAIGGNNTEDSVYILSYPECVQYFYSEAGRAAASTAYARKRGVHVSDENGNTAWLTRTPGNDNNMVLYVCSWGEVNQTFPGDIVTAQSDGVRPVVRIFVDE